MEIIAIWPIDEIKYQDLSTSSDPYCSRVINNYDHYIFAFLSDSQILNASVKLDRTPLHDLNIFKRFQE